MMIKPESQCLPECFPVFPVRRIRMWRIFLKKNAVEFTKKSQSVTYLVFSVESKELLGYFTLALKPLSVRGETVSKTTKRKLLRISELDELYSYFYNV